MFCCLNQFVLLFLRSTTWWSSPMPSWSTCPTLPALTSPSFAPAPATATVSTPWRMSFTRTCPESTAQPLSSTSPPRGISKDQNCCAPATPAASKLTRPESSDMYWRSTALRAASQHSANNDGKALWPFWTFLGSCALILQSTPPRGDKRTRRRDNQLE